MPKQSIGSSLKYRRRFCRNSDKEVRLDGNVVCVEFLRGTITLRVTLKNKISPWDWNNKVASYAFEMRDPEIVTDNGTAAQFCRLNARYAFFNS